MKIKLVVGFVLLLILSTIFYGRFPLFTDKKSIKDLIIDKYREEYDEIEINNLVEFKDGIVVVFTADKNVGKGIFHKNILGQYKLDNIGVGNSKKFRHSIQTINDIPYLIIAGQNNGEIDIAKTRFYGNSIKNSKRKDFEVSFEIPNEEYFIVMEKLDPNYRYSFLPFETNFYNPEGKDVSRLMNNE